MSNSSKKIPTVTAKVAPDLRRFVERTREAFAELDEGFENRVVTVIRRYVGGGSSSSSSDVGADTQTGSLGTGPGPGPGAEPPGKPTGLVAVSNLLSVSISWDKAPYYGQKHTELWAAPYHPDDNPDPSFEAATQLTATAGTLFIHSVDADTGFRYWVRHVNTSDVYGPRSDPVEGFVTWVQQPPKVTGGKTSARGGTIFVQWDYPSYLGHKTTEVWASTTDSFAGKTLLGNISSDSYADDVGLSQVRYYWMRHQNERGAYGEWSSTSVGLRGESEAAKTGTVEGLKATYLTKDTVQVEWNVPDYLGVARTQVRRSGGDWATTDASFYLDASAPAQSATYDVRHVNTAGVAGSVSTVTAEQTFVDDPEAPVNFTADPLFATVLLTWSLPVTLNTTHSGYYRGHSHTVVEVRVGSSAWVQAGVSTTTSILHDPEDTKTALGVGDNPFDRVYEYRAKHVSEARVHSAYCASVTADLGGTPDKYKEVLDASIRKTDLFDELDGAYSIRVHDPNEAQPRIAGFGIGQSGESWDFAIAADRFYIREPIDTADPNQSKTARMPFIVTTTGVCYDGEGNVVPGASSRAECAAAVVRDEAGNLLSKQWVEPGVYMDSTFIRSASITEAQIGDLRAGKIIAGTMAADRIGAGRISAGKIDVATTIEAEGYRAADESGSGGYGWRLDGESGSLWASNGFFRGKVVATSGSFTGALRGAYIAANSKLTAAAATGFNTGGEGFFAGADAGEFKVRIGNTSSAADKSRLIWNDGITIVGADGTTLLQSRGPIDGDGNHIFINRLRVTKLTSGHLDSQLITAGPNPNAPTITLNGLTGKAEFKDATVRGHIEANSGHFSGTLKTATLDLSSTLKTNSATSWSNGTGMFIAHDSHDGSIDGLRWRVGGGPGDPDGYKARIQWQGRSFGIYGPNGEVLLQSSPAGGSINGVYIDNLSANKITSGTLTSKTLTLDGGAIQSKVFNDSTGWRISGNGDAVFNSLTVRTDRADLETWGASTSADINSYVSRSSYLQTISGATRQLIAQQRGHYLVIVSGTGYAHGSSPNGHLATHYLPKGWLAVRAQVTVNGAQKALTETQQAGGFAYPSIIGEAIGPAGAVYQVKTTGALGGAGTFSFAVVVRDIPAGATVRAQMQGRTHMDNAITQGHGYIETIFMSITKI